MKLYHLTRNQTSYDEAREFVVRAPSEPMARRYAAEQAGDEGRDAWLDPSRSTCELLTTKGEAGVIVRDFHEG